jgi:hypothetical protein
LDDYKEDEEKQIKPEENMKKLPFYPIIPN